MNDRFDDGASDPTGRRPSVLDKYTGNQDRQDDSSTQHACYSEHATDLRMLDIQLANGDRVALPYHFLERVEYNPSKGFDLVFSTCRVVVVGSRLEPVYRGLLGHRVGYLAQVIESPAAVPHRLKESENDSVPLIRNISISAESA